MENNIPTAEEYVERFTGDDEDGYLRWDTVEHMCKEFAKLHVEAALKEAAEIVDMEVEKDFLTKDVILNAYPLTNIK